MTKISTGPDAMAQNFVEDRISFDRAHVSRSAPVNADQRKAA